MKYYCKKCVSVFEPGVLKKIDGVYSCPMCKNTMERIPYFETPQQYEKRTGKEFPNEGAVWCWVDGYEPYWGLFRSGEVKKTRLCVIEESAVIADPPIPPPDDWRPEEIKQ
jgi:hypothetical protein